MERIPGNLICLVVCLNLANTKILNARQQQEEQKEYKTFNTNGEEYQFKLRAPYVYTVEDLVVTLVVLFTIFLIILLWYILARSIIYCIYFRTKTNLHYITEEDCEEISYQPKNIGVGL